MKKIISVLLVCLIILSVFPVGVFAATVTTTEFTFELNSEKSGYILSKYNGTKTKAVIPSTYSGLPVTEIGIIAFQGNKTVEEISIPSTIKKIGRNAFTSCKALKTLVIPDSVEEIGEGIITTCTSIKSLTVPFIGKTRKQNDDDKSYLLGYFSGATYPDDINYTGNAVYVTRIKNKYGDLENF